LATAKTHTRNPRRWLWLILLVAALLGAAWLAWGDGLRKTGATGSAYAARVACSCRFVAGRSLDDCAKDKLDGMELISLSEDAETKSVTASIPLIASDTATYREGYGCLLQEWQD
tara:strand:- start:4547 stop:4891 length:345 start_codon:yes stop_codon:yes gene_type:complete